MPYANNAGFRIHYEVDGTGPALVLHHGFTQCLEDWFECGYVDALRGGYQLVLIDARGHGQSDKPHDSKAYTLRQRATDVTAVLDALGIDRAHFWGYSMGGWIAFGLAQYAPHRIRTLIIGGQHPFAAERSSLRRWLRYGIKQGPDALIRAFESTNGRISDSYAARMRKADLQAWLAMAEDRISLEDLLSRMEMPCCVYAGDADPEFDQVKAGSQGIANAYFFALPGLSHMQAFYQSSIVVPQVTKFLSMLKR
jgi:pimeloyl-ACP methyl ester carboxylesterase